ncbi:MAG: M28 family peptidase [Bacteroidales bacterium]|jgi:hypothetical protein|nr:M28 family peptidase [Bacteroidales bacterium]
MRKIIFTFLLLLTIAVSAQEIISNKGNRLQSYPDITTVNPAVQGYVEQVSVTNLENNIRYLQDLGVRNATTEIALKAQNWLFEQFESYGGLDVSLHYFTYNGNTLAAGNVVALKVGSEFPDEYIVISAHYDHQSGPGADDNASGTAGVLECAKILSQIETKRSVIFFAANCEEFGLVGSFAYVQKCAAQNMNIIAAFNLDQIGYNPPSQADLKMGAGYSPISKNLFNYYQQVANLYIPNIPTSHFIRGDHYNSDNTSFNIHGYASLYISDSEYNADIPCYHKPCDTLGNGVNSLELVRAFTQATLAAIAELANGWLPPQNLSAISDISKVKISWDETPQTSAYNLYKNGTLLAETTETSYEDQNVTEGEEYAYLVKAIHSETSVESAASNTDTILFTAPLKIPYFNDFETNSDGFVIRNSSWVIRDNSSNFIFSNASNSSGTWSFSDNYYNVVELKWFSIPEDTENISLKFDCNYNIGNSISAYGLSYLVNTTCYLEITTDRKTWHKLAKFQRRITNLQSFEISLNEYIGNPFVQIRFRFESFGPWTISNIKQYNIDNISISFVDVDIERYEFNYFKDLMIYPNPSNGKINITTFQEKYYDIFVYDMFGKKVFQQNNFQDGNLDLSSLPKGNYMIRVSNDTHSIAKKILLL